MPLDDVLKSADVVSVHLKLSEESKNLLNEARLRLMKKSAYLINTARGAIVDELALVKILKGKRDRRRRSGCFRRRTAGEKSPAARVGKCGAHAAPGLADRFRFRRLCRERGDQHSRLHANGKLTRALNPEALNFRRKVK